MLSFILISLISAVTFVNSAIFSYSVRQVTSPHTSKTYLLHNSHSSTSFKSASSICDSYPGAQLAVLSPSDIDYLGQFIESLDEPYWIGGLENGSGNCAALYYGGAVAIPKPKKYQKSPCETNLNVLCEYS
jgi:hypothetical protein